MSWVDQTLAEYGQGLGLDRLAFNDDGVASLEFEQLGALFIEKIEDLEAGDAVLVYMVREVDRPTAALYAKALELCHWDENPPFLVNASLRDERFLTFSTRLPQTDFSLPNMERLVGLLDDYHTRVTEGIAA